MKLQKSTIARLQNAHIAVPRLRQRFKEFGDKASEFLLDATSPVKGVTFAWPDADSLTVSFATATIRLRFHVEYTEPKVKGVVLVLLDAPGLSEKPRRLDVFKFLPDGTIENSEDSDGLILNMAIDAPDVIAEFLNAALAAGVPAAE